MTPASHLGARGRFLSAALAALLSACAMSPAPQAVSEAPQQAKSVTKVAATREGELARYHWLNRLTWGASVSGLERATGQNASALLEEQLAPGPALLPPAAQAQVNALTLSQQPFTTLVFNLEQRRRTADALKNDEEKRAAQQAYQQELTRLAREAATRHLLRALYSPRQLQEQMTWFWLNHFSVFQNKANIRALVGDYEDTALRPHALGRFRDLLKAAVLHPAMLVYLDNVQNAANRTNENLAREVMELHTLGAGGPYTQKDVQELTRVLTGAGINLTPVNAVVARRELQADHVRRGVFEFHPGRHDYNPKTLLGQPLQQRGLAEVEEALDRLARHPATARHVSRKLVRYWLSDHPPAALVENVAQAFSASDGDIAVALRALMTAPEFTQAAGRQFKDPMRYVVSALRLSHDDRVILNMGPVLFWLNRLGQPLYGRQTPDGWPLDEAAWSSPGQMTLRFEVARAIGSGAGGLFVSPGTVPPSPTPTAPAAPASPASPASPAAPPAAGAQAVATAAPRPPAPQEAAPLPPSRVLYARLLQHHVGPGTQAALAQAGSPQEWATFLLSSPEWMRR